MSEKDIYGYDITSSTNTIQSTEKFGDKTLYGRKMKLTIAFAPEEEAEADKVNLEEGIDSIVIELNGNSSKCQRVTFNIDYPGLSGWYYSEIVIYNFNENSLMQVLKEGAAVKLEAGYMNGNYGLLFRGYIFQALFEKENITDYKVTLMCVDGDRLFTENFTSFTIDSDRNNQVGIFNAIHAYSMQEIKNKKVTDKLNEEKHARGTTVFTTPARALNKLLSHYKMGEVANNCLFTEGGETVVFDIGDPVDPNTIQVSPDGQGGLIGTPVQTQYGCDFTVLLNANIILTAPRKLVKLNNTQIRAMKAKQGAPLAPLDEDLEYQVIGVRHEGDTRGDAWYTHVTGINAAGAQCLQETNTKWGL